jgi:hypothetical protein
MNTTYNTKRIHGAGIDYPGYGRSKQPPMAEFCGMVI